MALVLVFALACSHAAAPVPAAPVPPAAPVTPAPVTGPAPQDVFPAPARLVAVGDLHGDVPSAIGALQLAKVVDASGHWVGGDTWLVQTGDVLDRGRDARTMIDFLARIEAEAAAAGGRALLLDGNHEVMNLQGDWRYVADLADFPGATDAERDAARRAWATTGAGGAWVKSHLMTVQVGDTVFVHGGIDANWASRGISGLNQLFREALAAPVQPKAAVLGSDGPLWNRGYLLEDEPVACAELGRALKALGARRMVVGHTTQDSGRIATRCDGALYGIDTGISAYYGVHPSALVIEGERVTRLPE